MGVGRGIWRGGELVLCVSFMKVRRRWRVLEVFFVRILDFFRVILGFCKVEIRFRWKFIGRFYLGLSVF